VDIFETEPIEKSQYVKTMEESEEKMETSDDKLDNINMDEQVNYWSDYLRLKLHPRNLMTVNQMTQNQNETNEPFDLFQYGVDYKGIGDFNEDFEDTLRVYAEECDQIQGFHFFVDAFNGFGGLAKRILPIIKQEYSKKPVLSIFPFPFMEEETYETQMTKLINTSFTLRSFLSELDDILILPLSMFNSFPITKNQNPILLDALNYKPQLKYHTSGILASLIDCLSLPWRQKSHQTSLRNIYGELDIFKNKICSLQAMYPLEIEKNKYLFNFLQENNLNETAKWFTPLCSENGANDKTFSQIICCKGIPDDKVKNPKDTFLFKETVPAFKVLDIYCSDMYPEMKSNCYSIKNQLSVNLPFPQVFRNAEIRKEKSISLLTNLQLNNRVANLLKTMTTGLEKCKIRQYSRFFDSGMELEEYNEMAHDQKELYEFYASLN